MAPSSCAAPVVGPLRVGGLGPVVGPQSCRQHQWCRPVCSRRLHTVQPQRAQSTMDSGLQQFEPSSRQAPCPTRPGPRGQPRWTTTTGVTTMRQHRKAEAPSAWQTPLPPQAAQGPSACEAALTRARGQRLAPQPRRALAAPAATLCWSKATPDQSYFTAKPKPRQSIQVHWQRRTGQPQLRPNAGTVPLPRQSE